MRKIPQLKKSEKYLVLILLLCIGIFLLIWSIFTFLNEKEFISDGIKTTGKISGFEKRSLLIPPRGQGHAYFPIIAFTSLDRKVITFTSDSGANYYLYNVGDEVKVIYPSSNPYKAKIYSFLSIWAYPLGLLFVALIFLFFAFIILGVK